MKKGIVYSPHLTVKQNAEANKVSESAIRKYIRINGIDRKRDNAIIIEREIKELLKTNPNMSLTEISKILDHSVNTIKKYLNKENIVSNIDTPKVSVFDLSNKKFRISSVSDSQDEILNSILRLYIKKDRYECDITYSRGNFYRKSFPPQLKFDKYPLSDDVRPLKEFHEIKDNSLTSVVFDLPFILRSKWKQGSKIINRFDCFETIEELLETNKYMVNLSYSKLDRKGWLIIKTMDLHFANKMYSIHTFLINYAESMGLRLIDTFILIARTKILMKLNRQQRHAKKFHSYFLVFQKK